MQLFPALKGRAKFNSPLRGDNAESFSASMRRLLGKAILLPLTSLRRRVMARRRLLRSHVRSVTISAGIRFLVLRKFLFNRHGFWIGRFLVVLVT
jgi:hypothetical protein